LIWQELLNTSARTNSWTRKYQSNQDTHKKYMKVSRAVRNGFPSNPMHQVPVVASIDTHSNHNAPAPHEKFAMELIKRLDIDQIHQFMELMSGSNHSYCNRHASAAKM